MRMYFSQKSKPKYIFAFWLICHWMSECIAHYIIIIISIFKHFLFLLEMSKENRKNLRIKSKQNIFFCGSICNFSIKSTKNENANMKMKMENDIFLRSYFCGKYYGFDSRALMLLCYCHFIVSAYFYFTVANSPLSSRLCKNGRSECKWDFSFILSLLLCLNPNFLPQFYSTFPFLLFRY